MLFSKIIYFLSIVPTLSFIYSNKFNFLDKDHISNIANNWMYNWNKINSPISSLRVKECYQLINYNYDYKYEYEICLWKSNYVDSYLILLKKKYNTLYLLSILECPENIYYKNQISELNRDLLELCKQYSLSLDYHLIKKWSHGYYFIE